MLFSGSSPPSHPVNSMQGGVPTTTICEAKPSDNIYLLGSDPTKGSYITDFQGMTLYTFDKDIAGVSACTGTCATIWHPYTSGAITRSVFPTSISNLNRIDGSV